MSEQIELSKIPEIVDDTGIANQMVPKCAEIDTVVEALKVTNIMVTMSNL